MNPEKYHVINGDIFTYLTKQPVSSPFCSYPQTKGNLKLRLFNPKQVLNSFIIIQDLTSGLNEELKEFVSCSFLFFPYCFWKSEEKFKNDLTIQKLSRGRNSHYSQQIIHGMFTDSLLEMIGCLTIHGSNGIKARNEMRLSFRKNGNFFLHYPKRLSGSQSVTEKIRKITQIINQYGHP